MSLGTCMLVLPLFHPVQVAEQFALLDAASGGRAIIGVSPGWQQEEFAIVGVDYSRRIGRFTEAVGSRQAAVYRRPSHIRGKALPHQQGHVGLEADTKAAPANVARRQRRGGS
jgi:alkanesulfonate monooxygenase SsuD/methylene tetrahydromethanopterin reductase-like flavin-dependent oxidoreductase (luciferase family)